MFGRVTGYNQNKGFGHILGEDGNIYFIRAAKLYGEHLERGYYVFFKPFKNDRSDYNAKNVHVIEATEWRNADGNRKRRKPYRGVFRRNVLYSC